MEAMGPAGGGLVVRAAAQDPGSRATKDRVSDAVEDSRYGFAVGGIAPGTAGACGLLGSDAACVKSLLI